MKNRIIILLGTTMLLHSCQPNTAEQNNAPVTFDHILVIVGDDHGFATVGAYGNRYIKTPGLDRLAAGGVRFEKAYATSPICSASRQSVLCGKFPHSTGVNMLFTPFPDEGNTTIAEHLRERGFATAIIGKSHFNNWVWAPLYKDGPPDHGFTLNVGKQEYRQWLNSRQPSPIPDSIPTRANQSGEGVAWQKNVAMLPVPRRQADTEAAFFVDQALAFMQEQQSGRSLTWLAFHEPHAPFAFPVEYRDTYHPDSVPFHKGSPEDDRWVPEIFQDLTEVERRGIITSYYRSVTHMDAQIDRLLDSLEARDMLDRTLIVYFGDQGYLLNDHRRFEKHSFWEESIRAPLIFHGAGLPGGSVLSAPVSFVDIAPTIATLSGSSQVADFQGEGLADLLFGSADGTDTTYLFSEYLLDNKAMVVNDRWKYIFTSGGRDQTMSYGTGYGPSGMYHRLYDLKNDPQETTNLAYDPGQAVRVAALQDVMLDYFRQTHPDAADCPSSLNTLGQLVWYCEPRDLGGDYQERPARIFEGEPFQPTTPD
ncbi:sulfatase family protein [Phaeodactylibacter xiamenensis]|uniref:sulfatase family protein n=1 Tax=Phaeodactylibacter xiamenensis TaxID=1524460 RepID=UPI0024A89EBE|nr:sulfatase-like hydrolase/transferase [Phaeodactylibacter xiamenensis]